MTQQQIEAALKDLNQLVIDGKLMDAFEKYYHEEIEMQENASAPAKGKDFHRNREREFLANVTEFRSAHVDALAVNGDTSFVIWSYDYTHKIWGLRKYTQVSVQHWKDGKIIRERFFYSN